MWMWSAAAASERVASICEYSTATGMAHVPVARLLFHWLTRIGRGA